MEYRTHAAHCDRVSYILTYAYIVTDVTAYETHSAAWLNIQKKKPYVGQVPRPPVAGGKPSPSFSTQWSRTDIIEDVTGGANSGGFPLVFHGWSRCGNFALSRQKPCFNATTLELEHVVERVVNTADKTLAGANKLQNNNRDGVIESMGSMTDTRNEGNW